MEISQLDDLNSLRTAPLLSHSQEKKLLGELETAVNSEDFTKMKSLIEQFKNMQTVAANSQPPSNPGADDAIETDFSTEK